MPAPFVSVSLLSGDFTSLGETIARLNESVADSLHIDIIDGRFAPVFGLGYPLIQTVQSLSKKPMEFHLMVQDPRPHLSLCRDLGAQSITVHAEHVPQLYGVLADIKGLGCTAGVALSPHTSLSVIEEAIHYANRVLLVSVNPGWGGQKMLPQTERRIKQLKALIDASKLSVDIEIDGGVNLSNARQLCRVGACRLVAGAVVAKAPDPLSVLSELKNVNRGRAIR